MESTFKVSQDMEILTTHYKGFNNLIKNVANWKAPTILDTKNYHKGHVKLNEAKKLCTQKIELLFKILTLNLERLSILKEKIFWLFFIFLRKMNQ
jgi:hypothetical protein